MTCLHGIPQAGHFGLCIPAFMLNGNDTDLLLHGGNFIENHKSLDRNLSIPHSCIFSAFDLAIAVGHIFKRYYRFMDLPDHRTGNFRFHAFDSDICINIIQIPPCSFPEKYRILIQNTFYPVQQTELPLLFPPRSPPVLRSLP